MEFTYAAWGSGEIAVRAFNALAVVSASGELYGALSAVAVLSTLFLATGAAFNLSVESFISPLKLLLVIVLAGGILLAPSKVIVEDRFDGQDLLWPEDARVRGPVVVSAVPFGVALPAALGSSLSVALTRIFETAMLAVDAEDRLSSAGLWLSARALRAMADPGVIEDATLVSDFRYFLENCTYFDLQAQRVALTRLMHAAPLNELARTSGSITSLHSGDGSGPIIALNCAEAWRGATVDGTVVTGLQMRISNEASQRQFKACQSLRGIALATSHGTGGPAPGALTNCGNRVFAHALQTFGYTGTVIEQFRELVAIELLRDGAYILTTQDPQNIAFAKFVAERSRNAVFVVAGELAAVALPALRGMLEAIVLVLMPVLLVLGVLFFDQFARYLKTGLALILWLQLWPPIMAVINNVGHWIQTAAIRSHTIIAQGNFTLGGVSELLAEVDTQLALARYLLVLVPVLAWAMVRAGEFSGALLAGRLLQPGQQAAAGVGAHAAQSNWSTDQVNLEPRTRLGPHVASVGGSWGATTTHYPQVSTIELPSNAPGFVAATHSRTMTAVLQQRAEEAKVSTQEQRSQFSSSVESLYSEAFGEEGKQILNTLREEKVADSTSLRAIDSTGELIRQSVSRNRSIDQHSSTEHTWQTGVNAGLGTGFLPLPVSLDGKISSVQNQDVGLGEQMRRSYELLSDDNKSALHEVGDALERTEAVSASTTYTQVTSDAYQAKLSEAHQQFEAYTQTEQLAKRLTSASEVAVSSGQAVIREILKDPQQAELLGQFHQLYHVQGLPFAQAWSQAQEVSGVSLDVERISSHLLNEQPAALGEAAPASKVSLEQNYQEQRARVAQQGGKLLEPPEFEQAKQKLQQAQQEQQQPLPEPGEDFYQDSRTIDRTIRDADGEIMVIPDRSLYREGDKRLTEVWKNNPDDDE